MSPNIHFQFFFRILRVHNKFATLLLLLLHYLSISILQLSTKSTKVNKITCLHRGVKNRSIQGASAPRVTCPSGGLFIQLLSRFYHLGYNLLCSNISGRHNICHSARAPLCWQGWPRFRGEVHGGNRAENWINGYQGLVVSGSSDHNRPCRQIRVSGDQRVPRRLHRNSISSVKYLIIYAEDYREVDGK